MAILYPILITDRKWFRLFRYSAFYAGVLAGLFTKSPLIVSAQPIEKTSAGSIQKSLASHPGFINGATKELRNDLFGCGNVFIENVGQLGDTLKGYGYMGAIRYSYDGFDMPVLITAHGLIFLQRKINHPT